jgi:tRNA dimethylallyltransferase
MRAHPLVVFVVGPTAVGKTAVAFALAQKIPGEIVSFDAMQVYREAPIASSQPTAAMRQAVPHHLVGMISVEESFDVAAYNQRAVTKINEILGRGKTPIVTGGSGLYMQILLDGIFTNPARDENVRRQLTERLKQEGPETLYQELCQLDSDTAAKIHPHDEKRLVRALEVCRVVGGRFSEVKKNRTGLWGQLPILLYGLNRDREQLYAFINRRVEEMFEQGLVDEVRGLLAKKLSLTARSIIGVQEISGYLAGEYDLARAQYLLKLHTRHYAKRQLTWFRKEKRLNWLMISDGDSAEGVAEKIRMDLEKVGRTERTDGA